MNYQKIYRHVYDNPLEKDGSEKPNELLGEFELLDGSMDGYDYDVLVKDANGKLFILHGKEVSGYYSPGKGGTRNSIEPLEGNEYVQMYIKHSPNNL